MHTFLGLLDKAHRAKSVQTLVLRYKAETLLIFVKDPEVQVFLPAPGFAQTVRYGKVWTELLNTHASTPVYSEVVSFDSNTKKRVTLISYADKISFAAVGEKVPQSLIEETQGVLPFLAMIFQKEKEEQYAKVQLSEAEQSVIENKNIASKLEETRRELHKALIKTREEIEVINEAREFKDRVDLLTRQRNDLLRVNKLKDQFISVASHQLRTPATATKQYIGLILEGFAGELSPRQLQYLQVAYKSNEVQLSILNDLLKTAQLDSADVVLRRKQMAIKPVIDNVIQQLNPTFSLKHQTVVFECADSTLAAPINEGDIQLALSNVLENASKYTDAGKKITVKLFADTRYVTIEVQDEGVGMHEKDIAIIFEKFTRIDNELSDTVTGSGLGLYLVKRIVELHGGSIKVTSVLGEGSSFVMSLPL